MVGKPLSIGSSVKKDARADAALEPTLPHLGHPVVVSNCLSCLVCVLWSDEVISKAADVVVASEYVVLGLVDVVGQPKEERVSGIGKQPITTCGARCDKNVSVPDYGRERR